MFLLLKSNATDEREQLFRVRHRMVVAQSCTVRHHARRTVAPCSDFPVITVLHLAIGAVKLKAVFAIRHLSRTALCGDGTLVGPQASQRMLLATCSGSPECTMATNEFGEVKLCDQ